MKAMIITYAAVMLVLSAIFGTIGAFAWPYTLNSWLAFAGKPETVVWWQGFLLGMVPVVGYWSVAAAILTSIMMLVLA